MGAIPAAVVLLVSAAAMLRVAAGRVRGVRVRSRLATPDPASRRAGALGRGRSDRRFVAELPDVLDAIGRAAASGLSLVESLRRSRADASGALATDLDLVLRAVDAGTPVVEALEGWADRRRGPEVRLAICAVGQAVVSGGSIGRACHQTAQVLRANVDARRVVVSQAAQARASATVIGAAPVVVLLLASLVDTTAVGILFTTSAGRAALVAGLTLDAVAGWWMACLIGAAERVGR